jgi:hypothetical protein
MAVSMTPNGVWLQGDTPDGGLAACVAKTIIFVNEEVLSGNTFRTWVRTEQGVSAAFAGKQASAIYGLIKDLVI